MRDQLSTDFDLHFDRVARSYRLFDQAVSVAQQLAPFCRNISHRSGPRLRFPRLQNAHYVAQFPHLRRDTSAHRGELTH